PRSGAATEIHVPAGRRSTTRRAGAGLFVHAPVGTELVVLFPLLGVAEDLVGLVDPFELRLGRLIAGIDVGVMLARELPVGLLDFFFARVLRDAERRVVVLEIHGAGSRVRGCDLYWQGVLSNGLFPGVQPADFVTIALLVMLEGLLSADNAMVLAVLVLGLPKYEQKQALRYGIVG